MARLFDRDPVTGLTRLFHWDGDKQQFTIETQVDAEPVIEDNKTEFNADNFSGRKFKGDMHKVASIPLPIYMQLLEQGVIQDQSRLRAWLNDPDNRYFRTRPGRL